MGIVRDIGKKFNNNCLSILFAGGCAFLIFLYWNTSKFKTLAEVFGILTVGIGAMCLSFHTILVQTKGQLIQVEYKKGLKEKVEKKYKFKLKEDIKDYESVTKTLYGYFRLFFALTLAFTFFYFLI